MNYMARPSSLGERVPVSVVEALRARFGVDPRALAALRIGLGLLVLADVALRTRDLLAFYTDAGVLPRTLLVDAFPALGRVSFHALSGTVQWTAALFCLIALAAVALVAGYRSRLAALALFVLLASLHARNPLVLYAGDSLLRRILLWSALLPIGARWGLDAVGERRSVDPAGDERPDRVASLATAGLLVQVVAVYAVNAVLKLRGEAWQSGEALRYVFGVDALTTGVGDALAGYPALLAFGAHAWLALLVVSPLLVLATGRGRTALVAAFAGGHLFMLATLRIDLFPIISLVSLIPFLLPAVWDTVEEQAGPVAARIRALGGRLPRPGSPFPTRVTRPTTRTAAALLLAFVLVWNAAGVGLVSVSAPVDPTERRWDMFAPVPQSTDQRFVPVGTTTAGERVDAFRGGAPEFRPPTAGMGDAFPNHRWYAYLTDLRGAPGLRSGFAAYLCDRWDRRHESRLERIRLVVIAESVRPDAPNPTRRLTLGHYDCDAVVGASR